MRLEVFESNPSGYDLLLEGKFFRHCRTYSELATAIGSLIKSKFKGNIEGFI